jgi:hypothetical protein
VWISDSTERAGLGCDTSGFHAVRGKLSYSAGIGARFVALRDASHLGRSDTFNLLFASQNHFKLRGHTGHSMNFFGLAVAMSIGCSVTLIATPVLHARYANAPACSRLNVPASSPKTAIVPYYVIASSGIDRRSLQYA